MNITKFGNKYYTLIYDNIYCDKLYELVELPYITSRDKELTNLILQNFIDDKFESHILFDDNDIMYCYLHLGYNHNDIHKLKEISDSNVEYIKIRRILKSSIVNINTNNNDYKMLTYDLKERCN